MRTFYFNRVSSFFFFSLFLAYYQRSQTVCLPYFHTWCGPVRIWNAGWNALHAARWKYRSGHKTYAKKCCLRTIAQLWRAMSSQIKHAPIIGIKLVKQQYLLRMSSQYGELLPTSDWDSLGTPVNFNGFWHLGFITAATSFNGSQPNFARCLAVSWACTLYIHFRGLLPRNGILRGTEFTLHPSLALSYIGSVTARLSSKGASAKLCGVEQTAPRQGGHHVGYWPTF